MSGVTICVRNKHYQRGIQLYDSGCYGDAVSEFKKVLRLNPQSNIPEHRLASFYIGEAYVNMGLSHLNMSMYDRAIKELKLALLFHPEYADLHFSLGVCYYKQKRYTLANKSLQKALSINSEYAKALIYLGITKLQLGDETGIENLAQAVMIEPAYNDEGQYKRLLVLHRGGLIEDACKLAERIAHLGTSRIGSLLERSIELMNEGMYSEAASLLSEALSAHPGYADLWNYLGLCHLNQGITDQAISDFRKSLRINPNFISARVNLAAAYESIGRKYSAIEQIEHVLAFDSHNTEARDTLKRMKASV